MSQAHPDRAEILALLQTGRASASVERHLMACDRCARVLQEEAALEEACFEIATSERDRSRTTASGWVVAAIAAAACGLLLLGTVTAERRPGPDPAPTTVHVSALDGGAPPDGGPPPR